MDLALIFSDQGPLRIRAVTQSASWITIIVLTCIVCITKPWFKHDIKTRNVLHDLVNPKFSKYPWNIFTGGNRALYFFFFPGMVLGTLKVSSLRFFKFFPVKILICCPRDPACQPLFPLYCWTQVKYSLLYILGRFHSHILTYLTRLKSLNPLDKFFWL